MLAACKLKDVPVHLVSPVSNVRECPPFKSEPAPHLKAAELEAFQVAWELAKQGNDLGAAKAAALEALKLDPEHAGANFVVGRILDEQGSPGEAAEYLWRALDSDVCKLRAPREVVEVVHRVADELAVPCLRAQELFESRSRDALVGEQWLVDHIHPSVEGHQLLGEALADQVLVQHSDWVQNGDWRESIQTRFTEHLSGLGGAYFVRGQQRLEGLRLWTEGRAKKLRESSEAPATMAGD